MTPNEHSSRPRKTFSAMSNAAEDVHQRRFAGTSFLVIDLAGVAPPTRRRMTPAGRRRHTPGDGLREELETRGDDAGLWLDLARATVQYREMTGEWNLDRRSRRTGNAKREKVSGSRCSSRTRRTCSLCSTVVLPRLRAEGDRDAVPAVDHHHRPRQLHQLLFAEVLARFFVHVIGHVRLADERQRLRPGKRRALPIAVERRFAPGIEQVDALLRFAAGARVDAVHVDAVRAAVDLRRADLDQLQQRMLEAE